VRLLGGGERRQDRVGVGDVGLELERTVRRTAAPGGDRDLVTLRDERLGDRAADAAVAAGDQDGAW
jgi:hypothetical protein